MTEEELVQEATTTVQWECTPMIDRPTFVNGYITSAKSREKRIAELMRDNTELREQLKLAKEMPYSAVKKFAEEKTQDQLTKAKEIIKELYEGLDKLYLSGLSAKQIAFIEQLQDKTEPFLNEVEK